MESTVDSVAARVIERPRLSMIRGRSGGRKAVYASIVVCETTMSATTAAGRNANRGAMPEGGLAIAALGSCRGDSDPVPARVLRERSQ